MLKEVYPEPVPQPENSVLENITTYPKPSLISRFSQLLKYLGPAFIVSVAYIDPGNFATNISGGSFFNYQLIWVILWSNLMAIFLQTLSAKLGIATGCNLPEMCGRTFCRKTNYFLWLMATFASMATALAEFLGASLGLYLLFGVPLIQAGFITAVLTFFIVYTEKYGQRVVEALITVLVGIIGVAYTIELFLAKPAWPQVAMHTLIPSLPNGEAVLIAVGMLGATVMPHVIYLHSQLVQSRKPYGYVTDKQKQKHLRMEKIDIVLAMNIAFIVNAAMVVVSAAIFYNNGVIVESIEQAHRSLAPLAGTLSSAAFGIALLASGLSSSAVGTLAGQTVMDGFIGLKIPLNIRRLLTVAPALIIISLGINPMKALVLSQVSLSFALPAAIIPMILLTSRKDIMGTLVNDALTKYMGWFITLLILSLNGVLLFLTFSGKV
ncbi:Nramp family divalent metal transporter [Candidatus Formimonas warabiya]|uniref:Divalent metal cation transporter MntH n=1 Tax=Formimonas warabiya TaxID=1761012 RepID=A0A3G1KVF3_FORW1|nr:Nramp family divalent metal transporter [Candidatus Formimonas warabiya]ATW26421.1 divalent metal cation transporter [Candidatus Formimonas warabiya]